MPALPSPHSDSSISSGGITDALLGTHFSSSSNAVKQAVLAAEDLQFSREQSEELGPWLLNYACFHRGSSSPQDEPVVLSAIRTGASMLKLDQAELLSPLLEPGHPIETSLVALKMVGRFFEAQPPADLDEHPELAQKVCSIATSLLNDYAISISQSAAMANLSLYALATLASQEVLPCARIAETLSAKWFARRACRKLRNLERAWQDRPVAVSRAPLELLDQAIGILQQD
jgi:hypothetical protein